MGILLLKLDSPMQSWGTQSRFSSRDTGLEPSKSGIIGLLCAALGKPRFEKSNDYPALTQLAALKMGVRVDYQGTVERDYQTALNVFKAGGSTPKECEPSDRYYLADACFLVGLKGDTRLLEKLQNAVINPVWQLYLGRKAFVPASPLQLQNGLKADSDDLLACMGNHPYVCPEKRNLPDRLRVEVEMDFGQGDIVRNDQPLSFSERRFALRHVSIYFVDRKSLPQTEESNVSIKV